jgi:hypothetical protein
VAGEIDQDVDAIGVDRVGELAYRHAGAGAPDVARFRELPRVLVDALGARVAENLERPAIRGARAPAA